MDRTLILNTIGEEAIRYHNENSVDIQSDCVVIHYPVVRISNEQKVSHTIRELYVTIAFDERTRLRVYLTRTFYSLDEWYYGYTHSHCPTRTTSRGKLCTGSSELGATMERIPHNQEDLQYWAMSFISLLDKSLSVESLAGGPYCTINNLYTYQSTERVIEGMPAYNCTGLLNRNGIKDKEKINKENLWIRILLKYMLENNVIEFKYTNHTISFAQSFAEIKRKAGITFFKLCNENEVFRRIVYNSDPQLLIPTSIDSFTTGNVRAIPTDPVIVFKGEPKTIRVDQQLINGAVYIRSEVLQLYLSYILIYLNIKYDNKQHRIDRKEESEG